MKCKYCNQGIIKAASVWVHSDTTNQFIDLCEILAFPAPLNVATPSED